MELMILLPLGLGVLIILFGISTYNSLIGKRNQVDNIFASVDALLKKRYDLIPNLVAALQQYMQYESGTLEKITELRTRALQPGLSAEETIKVNNEITQTMGKLMVSVEQYPDLKASNNFQQLQVTMTEIEEQVSAARRAYNAAITSYNNAIEMFPSSLIAGLMGFQRKSWFEASEVERENVNVAALFGAKS